VTADVPEAPAETAIPAAEAAAVTPPVGTLRMLLLERPIGEEIKKEEGEMASEIAVADET
jgi:hypothetical protein